MGGGGRKDTLVPQYFIGGGGDCPLDRRLWEEAQARNDLISHGVYPWTTDNINVADQCYHCTGCFAEIGPPYEPCLKSPTIPLQPLPVITNVWYRVRVDLTGPLVESEGYKYIVCIIELLQCILTRVGI